MIARACPHPAAPDGLAKACRLRAPLTFHLEPAMQRTIIQSSPRQLLRQPLLRRMGQARHLLLVPLAACAVGLAGPAAADDDIPIDQLPPAVVQALQQRFPGAKIEDAERKTRDGQEVFEVEIEVDNDDKDVILTPEGKILEVDD